MEQNDLKVIAAALDMHMEAARRQQDFKTVVEIGLLQHRLPALGLTLFRIEATDQDESRSLMIWANKASELPALFLKREGIDLIKMGDVEVHCLSEPTEAGAARWELVSGDEIF